MKYNLIKYCEIDKYAQKSYDAIHGTTQEDNLVDVMVADFKNLQPSDIIVGGSPCQDFSIAGNKKGSIWTCSDCGVEYNPILQHYKKRNFCIECGSDNITKTRSSLLIEYLRSIRENNPKFFIYENVKNILGKNNKKTFEKFTDELREYGYEVHYNILNAKDFDIPQNRERVFVVGIRKDIANGFDFPKKLNSSITLNDILEDEVDSKYYMTGEKAQKLLQTVKDDKKGVFPSFKDLEPRITYALGSREHRGTGWKNESPTLCARDYKDPKIVAIPIDSSLYNPKELKYANCITARYNAGIQNRQSVGVCIVEKDECEEKYNKGIKVDENSENYLFIRKLTPLECWKLMGFEKVSYRKAQEVGISDCQLYKQAGNSIVVDVIFNIYKELEKLYPEHFKDGLSVISLFSGIGAFEEALKRV